MKRIKKSFKQLVTNTKTEMVETKEVAEIIWKSKDKTLTSDEKEKIKQQGADLFKITFLGALFIVPGSAILILLLVRIGKKFGVNLLPSSFDNKNKNE